MNAFRMEELENEFMFITKLTTHTVENSYGTLDKPEGKFRQQWERKTTVNDSKLRKLPTGKMWFEIRQVWSEFKD